LSHACLIANPAAGGGRGARRLPGVRQALAAVGIDDVRVTRGPGDERELAAEAAASGIDTIVALGGDGTWGNVARGIRESGRDARLVPVAAGTGNDFPRSLSLPANDAVAMARIAAGNGFVRADLGFAGSTTFLNVAGVGLEAAVLLSMRTFRRLSGPLAYVAAALPLLRSFRPLSIAVQVDDQPVMEPADFLAIVVSNGPRFGGGFLVAPGASVTDGLLDAVAVRDASPLRRLNLFVRARLGRHVGQPEVAYRRVRRIRLHLDEPPLIDADGELHALVDPTVDIGVLAGAIRIGVAEKA
jgi:diacylglycerol kinase (ATP)